MRLLHTQQKDPEYLKCLHFVRFLMFRIPLNFDFQQQKWSNLFCKHYYCEDILCSMLSIKFAFAKLESTMIGEIQFENKIEKKSSLKKIVN